MASTAPNRYDQVLYHSFAQEQAHPDRFSTLARLFGLETAPVERCRFLEIGCGTGGHLWPMAALLPESTFVGIDLAQRPIDIGKQVVAELGLRNLELRAMNLMDVDAGFGQFDFIVAHGVYSWVPDFVRDKVMAVFKQNLAPNGVAYVSYNAYPGGWLRRMVRDMLLYHTRFIDDPLDRAMQGKALLEFMIDAVPDPDTYRSFLKKEVDGINKTGEWLLCHDEMGEIYEPFYFYQVAEHAQKHGLQYLSEAEFTETQSGIFRPEVVETLSQLGDDLIAREQYSDFLKCRKFRQTLFVHEEVELDRRMNTGQVPNFLFCSTVQCTSPEPSIRSDANETFEAHAGKASVTTNNPLAKAVLWHLGRVFPRVLTFDELVRDVREILRPGAIHDGSPEDLEGERKVRAAVADIALRTYAANLIEFHVYKPPVVTELSERPVAFPVARWQARQSERVSTLRHTSAQLEDGLLRAMFLMLDGTRTRAEITTEVARIAGASNDISAQVDANLRLLARQALLVA